MPITTFILDDETLSALDKAIAALDTDRSKFIRSAIRERLASINITALPAPAGAQIVPVVNIDDDGPESAELAPAGH